VIDSGLAFIFDMDGVLVDSNPVHREAWAAYNLRFGLETTAAMHERMYGRRNDDIIRDFFGEGLPPEEVVSRGREKEELYRGMIAHRIDEILVPGLRQFLEQYANVPKGLASNAQPENIDFLLDRAELRHHFRVVVNGQQVREPKPHPEIYLKTAKMLKVNPVNCIVFEDSYSGVEAARRAGMRIVGVSTTYVNLPGSTITIDNFLGGDLTTWLSHEKAV
jgi:beta-phosphoglucomutase